MTDTTPTLTDEQREQVRYALGPFSTCDVDALAPLIARMVTDAERRALVEAADLLDSRRSLKGIASRALDPGVHMAMATLRDLADRIGGEA